MKAPATPERCKRAPSIKLKGLQWQKLRTRQINGAFWTKINHRRYDDLPYEEIEDIFAAVVVQTKIKESTKKRDVTIIDPKRAQNIAIMLSRFKCTVGDISTALITLDAGILDLETVNQLAKYLPSKEEIDAITTFVKSEEAKSFEERSTLGKAEKFFLQIGSIPKISERIQALHFKYNFPEKLYMAKPDIRKVYLALTELKESKKLFDIMEFSLILGNFINYGTFRGNASGFKIEGLMSLADTRSAKRTKFNLIHYIVEWLSKNSPDLLTFPEEIENVGEAATVCFAVMCSEIRALRTGLDQLEKELPIIPSCGEKDVFSETMSQFLVQAKEELNDAEHLIEETEKEYALTLKHFAEESKNGSKTPQPEDFIAVFKKFLNLFVSANKDLEAERTLAEKAARREEERNARISRSKEAKKNQSSDAPKKANKKITFTPHEKQLQPVNSQGKIMDTIIEEDDSDNDNEASNNDDFMNYIREVAGTDDENDEEKNSSKIGSSDEDEAVIDDVIAMVRDGEFRKKYKNNNPKAKGKESSSSDFLDDESLSSEDE